ncbi:folylpolyglutamate synthase [Xylariaceae sp. FL1019]|nr:folylpolyglutamate synthase [Xylariaceae sp. FL1019]
MQRGVRALGTARHIMSTTERSYEDAIAILRARRRQKRPNTGASTTKNHDRIPDAKGKLDLRGTPSIQGMREWLQLIGHSPSDVDRLNVVHVAGTKGKGSTCAFAESFLRTYGERTGIPSKTGLYTSPHLIHPEERIRINFRPLARPLFAKYFFEVWDKLSQLNPPPRFLQLYCLFATHVFIREGVEAAIYETHHGGEYDATNFLDQPVATIVTPLGMDHISQLGPTLNNIAWHKAGIFKPGALAFSAVQESGPTEVIKNRAAEKAVDLSFVSEATELPRDMIQLKPDVQRANCSLALAAVRGFLDKTGASHDTGPLQSEDIQKAITRFSWPGRFQYICKERTHWFLDGAHNEMSVVKAAEWFIEGSEMIRDALDRVLVFAQVSEERDTVDVFRQLALALQRTPFDHIIIASYEKREPLEESAESAQAIDSSNHEKHNSQMETFATLWRELQPNSTIHLKSSPEGAMDCAREIALKSGGVRAFVTGSLFLMGSALRYLA